MHRASPAMPAARDGACQVLVHFHHPSNLQVRPLGVNMLVADVFDAGLLGDGFPYLLELARRQVLQPGATVVPAGKARLNGLYCRKDTVVALKWLVHENDTPSCLTE